MLEAQTLAGDALKDDVNDAPSFLEEFDDMLHVYWLKPSCKIFLQTGLKMGASFVDHFYYFCLVFVMLSCASVY